MAEALHILSGEHEQKNGTKTVADQERGVKGGWRGLLKLFEAREGASRAEKIIHGRRVSLILSLMYWLLMVTASAFFFSNVETTGSSPISFGDAMYMAVMTSTTIGFGDFSPHSTAGRVVAVVWILVTTFVTANVLGNISAVFIEDRALRLEERMLRAKLSRRDLKELDTDADGAVDEMEYLVGMLVRTRRVEQELIDDIRAQFRNKNTDGAKSISIPRARPK